MEKPTRMEPRRRKWKNRQEWNPEGGNGKTDKNGTQKEEMEKPTRMEPRISDLDCQCPYR